MYVIGSTKSEVRRQLEVDGEFLVDKQGVLFNVRSMADIDDESKVKRSKKVKTGEHVWLNLSGTVTATKRILHWCAHPELANSGVVSPSFLSQAAGDPSLERVRFGCLADIDLDKLPYIFRVMIVDQVVR
jgi:hypothetical protein